MELRKEDTMSESSIDIQDTKENKVNREVKKGVIEIYDDLLKTIWDKILPTLGIVTVVTIAERAISRTAQKYPCFRELRVSEKGMVFDGARAELDCADKEDLKNGFKELVTNLFDILAKLTGNILIGQLMKEVEGIEINNER